jgi:hypothetical protein
MTPQNGWTKESVAAHLSGTVEMQNGRMVVTSGNPKWVERTLTVLYARQTASEQSAQTTVQKNGVGFSGFDGEIFSSFARQVATSTYVEGKRLSPKQLGVCWKPCGASKVQRIARYAGQVLEILEGLQRNVAPAAAAPVAAAPIAVQPRRVPAIGRPVDPPVRNVPVVAHRSLADWSSSFDAA